MQTGKILVAEHQGAYLVKLVGDVRVTLCASFDEFLDRMLANPAFRSVLIDLSETEGLDSTSLGLLAKLSIETQKRYGFLPVVISTNESVTRLLVSMGFDRVFEIHTEAVTRQSDLEELPVVPCSEEEMRDTVIEAHKVLMGLNEENRARFHELVTTLERNRCGATR